jgi:dimethylaniline monooxygenase (N-oxide forming)
MGISLRTYGKTDIELGEKSSELFDAVLVCSGHHAEPYVPHFAGETNYQGRLIHSLHYKESNGYEQKRVVVVGIGNSGADIAVELSRVCAQVT